MAISTKLNIIEADVCIAGNPAQNGVCGNPECVCAPYVASGARSYPFETVLGGDLRNVSHRRLDAYKLASLVILVLLLLTIAVTLSLPGVNR